jgi:hypothetical protein
MSFTLYVIVSPTGSVSSEMCTACFVILFNKENLMLHLSHFDWFLHSAALRRVASKNWGPYCILFASCVTKWPLSPEAICWIKLVYVKKLKARGATWALLSDYLCQWNVITELVMADSIALGHSFRSNHMPVFSPRTARALWVYQLDYLLKYSHYWTLPDLSIRNNSVRFEVFTAVTMKNGVFWVVTPCGSCKNRRFGGT